MTLVIAPNSIDKEGVYEISEEMYHSDTLCKTPTLSSSIGKIMVKETAAKAWINHPRLNPKYEPTNRYIFDLGHASHLQMLGSKGAMKVLPFENWRTGAAQFARDECYENGVIPILEKDWDDVVEMARVARLQLNRHFHGMDYFRAGRPEQTLVWREDNGIICRAKLDWYPDRLGNVFPDFKSTGADPGPDGWGHRQCWDTGCDFQDAFYSRGIKRVLGIEDPAIHFVVQENKAPFALAVHALSAQARAAAAADVEMAIDYWGWCLKNNAWPGYSRYTYENDAPPWHLANCETRRINRLDAQEQKRDAYAELTAWQAPLALPKPEDK